MFGDFNFFNKILAESDCNPNIKWIIKVGYVAY